MHLYDTIVVGAGQAGLASGYQLARAGLDFTLLEAAQLPGGAWPRYYDSLTLFSPARHASLPGLPFPGDPDHYPRRDEVTAYLRAYAAHFNLPIITGFMVDRVSGTRGGFVVWARDGRHLRARTLIAATGSFGRPYWPRLPGQSDYTGHVLHAAEYRHPSPFAGQRVIVVGAGNSAVQIATELAEVATVTLATRQPVRWVPQRILGRDLLDWLMWTGLDWVADLPGASTPVLDQGRYRRALRAGRPTCKPMFVGWTQSGVVWADGTETAVDTVIMATGYRPDLGYLTSLGALDANGAPVHDRGISQRVPGLYYVGLERQTAFRSATLRGVGADAARVTRHLRRHLTGRRAADAPCCSGLTAPVI